jgi:iron complex transport system ATP-binding protein
LKEGRISSVGSPSEVMSVEVLREVYGCDVLVDLHPESGLPRITLPRQLRPFTV